MFKHKREKHLRADDQGLLKSLEETSLFCSQTRMVRFEVQSLQRLVIKFDY